MALTTTGTWEIQSSGNDFNGGLFNPTRSLSGNDWTVQTNPRVIIDDVAVSGFAVGTTTFRLYGYTISSGDLGNTVNIFGTATVTAGRYEITAVTLSTNTWTLDRAFANVNAVNITGRMGGAMQTLDVASANALLNHRMFCKNPLIVATGCFFPTNVGTTYLGQMFIGYQNQRYDGQRCDVFAPISGFRHGGTNGYIANFNINAGNTQANTPVLGVLTTWMIENVRVWNSGNSATVGISSLAINTTRLMMYQIEVSGFTNGIGVSFVNGNNGSQLLNSYIHHNGTGIRTAAGEMISNCLIDNNLYGISALFNTTIFNNVITNSTSDGILMAATTATSADYVVNNYIADNGGYGINSVTARPPRIGMDGNYFYNNTSGPYNNFNTVASGSVFYNNWWNNQYDIIASSPSSPSPVNSSFYPTTSPSGGDLMRNSGPFNTWIGFNGSSFTNYGPIQPRNAIISIGMNGGF